MAASARRRLAHVRLENWELDTAEAGAALVKCPVAKCRPAPRAVRAQPSGKMADKRGARAPGPPFATISLAGFGAPGEQGQHVMPAPVLETEWQSDLTVSAAMDGTFLFSADRKATTATEKQAGRKQPQQHFMIASAADGKRLTPEGVPAWRGVLANLLAGATAGCAVEAGEACHKLVCIIADQHGPDRRAFEFYTNSSGSDTVPNALQRCTPSTRSRRACRWRAPAAAFAHCSSLAAARRCTLVG